MYKMNPEIKQRWIAALRSGEYKQGKFNLKATQDGADNFCCLGVLCDLYDPKAWIAAKSPSILVFFDACSLLPKEVKEWSGILTDFGFIGMRDRNGFYISLSELNDSEDGLSFDQIADVIEYFF